ncbi:PQQ-dependent sugar dehydrogenase [Sphingobium sp. H39-3-25]|uniref:PQQ-dependent sugar dehydrogenase n=1 Tax=Sphingobium arseniciresistens TaxID=3030834 RepID=UPI0023B92EB3|nr:PQQ-dependent sugar dehydrogenase [Sphingobium arseniciresistens]
MTIPDGPGKTEFLAKCSQCHSAGDVLTRRRSAEDWRATVDRMTTLGAVLSADEQTRILAYLTTNYGEARAGTPDSARASLAPSGSSPTEPAVTSSPQHTRPVMNARLMDYLEMPATGNFATKDARSQVARINFLVGEPGGRRLFVGDSSGPLYLVDKRTKRTVPYLDFKGVFPRFVAEAGFASGLLAATFDPEYRRNGIFYTIHLEVMTSTAPAMPKGGVVPGLDISHYKPTAGVPTPSGPAPLIREAVVVEWTDSNTQNSSFEGSNREVLRVQLLNSIHPTNDLSFNPAARRGDPDWRVLYIATGDGGTGEQNDVRRLNPQRLDHFGGKIIRIVPDLREHASTSQVSENGQYRIPSDNPFISTPGARKEIWATGMRNPHRMTWDGAKLLSFVIGSNGVFPGPRYETINLVRKGANFGYPLREGPEFKALNPVYGSVPTDNSLPVRISDTIVLDQRMQLQDSALAYKTTVEGNAIANGFVYRGKRWPALQGAVVFGDITSGRIFYAKMADLEAATDGDPTTLAPFGEIKTDLPQLAIQRMRARTPPPSPEQVGAADTATAQPARPRPPRIDMRLATDSDGEIYVLTKSDGVIRRIVSVE